MADEIDLAQDRQRIAIDAAVNQVRRNATMPVGEAGECVRCGEWMPRLVLQACAPCRDKFKLP